MVHLGDSDKVLQAIETWARNADSGNPDANALAKTVEDLLQQDTSYAEQNAKRFRQVNEAFQKQDFEVIVNVVDFLMMPLDTAINRLLSVEKLGGPDQGGPDSMG